MSLYDYLLTQDGIITKDSLLYPFEERGLPFGDGVYEVIRIYQGTFDLLEEHIDRLYRSAEAIRLEVPFDKDALIASLHQLTEKNDVQTDAKLYLQITRGSAPREHSFPDVPSNFYAYIEPSERPVSPLQHGVHAVLADDIRWELCYIKSLNLLPNILAKQTAKERGAFEAILHRMAQLLKARPPMYSSLRIKFFTHIPLQKTFCMVVFAAEYWHLHRKQDCK